MEYNVHSSFNHLDVFGKVLAGDGSGGRLSKDFRTRRCGFGLVIIDPSVGENIGNSHLVSAPVLGLASGSVPGKQTVPRAEAVALLQALCTTSGNATFSATT